jgi:uncharacterized protein (DUF433 family)
MWDRITIDPEVFHGQPCIRGLRIPVSLIVKLIAAGQSPQQIVEDYPELELADIQQALEYAAWLAAEESYPVRAA